MPLDPLAVELPAPITHERPRWQIGQAPNPLGGTPAVKYLGEWVYCTADGTDVGTPRRDPSLDINVPFDPQNATHVQGFTALDQVVKDAYAAKLAAQQ